VRNRQTQDFDDLAYSAYTKPARFLLVGHSQHYLYAFCIAFTPEPAAARYRDRLAETGRAVPPNRQHPV
jgi:hypothetical protein